MNAIIDAYEISRFMEEKNVLLVFTGEFDHRIISVLLKNIKGKLNPDDITGNTVKRVYHVLVESIENIGRHATQDKTANSQSIFMVCRDDSKYTVISGNPILNSNIPALKEKLDKVMNLSLEELKQMYRDQIQSGKTTENGAGLGIIDIAIKTGNSIQYDFFPLTNETSFYQFQTEISI